MPITLSLAQLITIVLLTAIIGCTIGMTLPSMLVIGRQSDHDEIGVRLSQSESDEPVLPSDIETDCEPAPLEVVEHQSPQPLSDERLEDIALDVMGYAVLDKAQNEVAMELMRKVEAAHGITKGPQQ